MAPWRPTTSATGGDLSALDLHRNVSPEGTSPCAATLATVPKPPPVQTLIWSTPKPWVWKRPGTTGRWRQGAHPHIGSPSCGLTRCRGGCAAPQRAGARVTKPLRPERKRSGTRRSDDLQYQRVMLPVARADGVDYLLDVIAAPAQTQSAHKAAFTDAKAADRSWRRPGQQA